MIRFLFILVLICSTWWPAAGAPADVTFPELTGLVTDPSSVLSPKANDRLKRAAQTFGSTVNGAMAVVVLPSFDGVEWEAITPPEYVDWIIGRKKTPLALLIVVSRAGPDVRMRILDDGIRALSKPEWEASIVEQTKARLSGKPFDDGVIDAVEFFGPYFIEFYSTVVTLGTPKEPSYEDSGIDFPLFHILKWAFWLILGYGVYRLIFPHQKRFGDPAWFKGKTFEGAFEANSEDFAGYDFSDEIARLNKSSHGELDFSIVRVSSDYVINIVFLSLLPALFFWPFWEVVGIEPLFQFLATIAIFGILAFLGFDLNLGPKVSASFQRRRAASAALQEDYFKKGLDRNRAQAGVLIRVSLIEKRIGIMADIGIIQRVNDETWDAMLGRFKRCADETSLDVAIREIIEECGRLLTTQLPIDRDLPTPPAPTLDHLRTW